MPHGMIYSSISRGRGGVNKGTTNMTRPHGLEHATFMQSRKSVRMHFLSMFGDVLTVSSHFPQA